MRLRLRLAALALVASLGSGCFVFDELDKGNKILDEHSPTRNAAAKKKQEEAAKAAAPAKAEDPNAPKKSWWERARTISAADKPQSDDPHVRCQLRGKERYMTQSDCLTQGGKLLSVPAPAAPAPPPGS